MGKQEYREFASHYDQEVKAYDSYGHEVLFGMGFEYVKPGQRLLDIGIGTGLASIHFAQMGLKVHGLDASQEMLSACESKGFAESLRLFDMAKEAIPFEDGFFDHVICCGVLHFLGDLGPLLSEARRVMKRGGVFALTIAPHEGKAPFIQEPTEWGVPIFKHSPAYIQALFQSHGLSLLKEQRLLIKGADKATYSMLFSALIARFD